MRERAENNPQCCQCERGPSVTQTGALMAALLESAVADAGRDFNAIAELLGEAMMALPPEGSEAAESVLMEMIDRLQCFDLLSQRMGHVKQVLETVAGAESSQQLDFFSVTDELWRVYCCQAERTTHNEFLQRYGLPQQPTDVSPEER